MADLYALYKPWRNRLAALDRRESLYVLWAYSQARTVSTFRMPPDIKVHKSLVAGPVTGLTLWELETLAGEIILNGGEMARGKHSLKDGNHFAEIVQGLRNLENEIYGAQDGADVLVEIWRISHRQFTYQQKRLTAAETIRYYMIYNDDAIDAICQAQLGLSVYEVFFIDMLFLGVYFTSPRQAYPVGSDIRDFPPEKIEKWLAFASTDLSTLAAELKKTHRIDASYAYRYSPLRQYPILRQRYAGAQELLCPVPVLVQWRVNNGLYFALLTDPDFTNALGTSFERFCGEVLRRALAGDRFKISADAAYGTRQRSRRTPDWIVTSPGSNAALVVECKTARPTAAARETLTDLAALERDFAKLSEAVVQIYSRIVEYKQGQWPQLDYDANRTLYPLVVTLEDWFVLGPRLNGLLDQRVRERLGAAGMNPDLMQEAPYAVISINDLERLAQVIPVIGIAGVMEAKLRDDARRTELWHGFLSDFAPNIEVQRTLFQSEYDQMFARTLSADNGAR